MKPTLRLRLALAAICAGAFWAGAAPAQQPSKSETAAFNAWREQYIARTVAKGYGLAVARGVLDPARPDMRALARSRMRPADRQATAHMVQAGRAALKRHKAIADQIAARYGVDAGVIVAVWGMDSNYGLDKLTFDAAASLATLAAFTNKRAYYEANLDALLGLVAAGRLSAGRIPSDWNGGLGQPRIMPETYYENAVDWDRDGLADLSGSTPDVLASIANFLVNRGWQAHQPLFTEAAGVTTAAAAAAGESKTLSEWGRLGLLTRGGAPFSGARRAKLLLPQGLGGPAVLTYANFDVLRQHGDGTPYAVSAALLARAIAGGRATLTPAAMVAATAVAAAAPPPGDGLSQAETAELQRLLARLGFKAGAADGVTGAATRRAALAFAQRAGLSPLPSYPNRAVLNLARIRAANLSPSQAQPSLTGASPKPADRARCIPATALAPAIGNCT